MKFAGLLLLASGWVIVLAAIVALPPSGNSRAAFAVAGFGVELVGLAIMIAAHIPPVEEKR